MNTATQTIRNAAQKARAARMILAIARARFWAAGAADSVIAPAAEENHVEHEPLGRRRRYPGQFWRGRGA